MQKSALKTELKKYDAALEAGDKAALDIAYRTAVKHLIRLLQVG